MGKEFRDGFQNYVRKEVPANNRKGRRVVYEYQGEMRHFVMTAAAFRTLKVRLGLLALAGAALLVGTLCLPVPSNATNLVTLPAMFGLFAVAYTVYGVLNLFTTRQDAPAWEYNTVNHALTGGTVIAMGLLAAALALDIGYQLLVLKAFVPLELASMGGYALCIVLELAVFRLWRGLTVTAHKAEPEQQSPQAPQ